MPEFRFCPLCAAPLEPVADGPDAGRPACPTGHFVHYDNPAVTTFGFVRDDRGRYLALRRAREPFAGHWDLPGGFVEPGETPAQALRREVREETGLDVEPGRLLGAFASRYGDGGRWTVDVGFECAVTGGTWRLDPESTDAAWHPLDELPRLAFAGERAGLAALRG
ncbi:MAG: NUDIX hydrolase [Solirubrobacterales bacterium]